MPEMKEEEKEVSPVIMQYGGSIPTDAELQVEILILGSQLHALCLAFIYFTPPAFIN